MMLIKLDLPYALPEFDAERKIELVAVCPSRLKRENPIKIVRKEGPKTVPTPEKKVKQVKKQVVQVGSNLMPPIENFREFKGWLLKKLEELENISQQNKLKT